MTNSITRPQVFLTTSASKVVPTSDTGSVIPTTFERVNCHISRIPVFELNRCTLPRLTNKSWSSTYNCCLK